MNKSYIVTLNLNEAGKLAIGGDTKSFELTYIENREDITEDLINTNFFPKILWDSMEIKDSYRYIDFNTIVSVINADGEKHIGRITRVYDCYNKNIEVTDMFDSYLRWNFKTDGTEATRCKNKAKLEIATEADIEYYNMNHNANSMYEWVLKHIMNSIDYEAYSCEEIARPTWMTIEVLKQIIDIIDNNKLQQE